MYSRPLRLVHCILQADVQVWQPMHLLRSITMLSCRLTPVAISFAPEFMYISERLPDPVVRPVAGYTLSTSTLLS